MSRPDVAEVGIEVLLHVLKRRHDYDFSGYAAASLRRRVEALCREHGCVDVMALARRLLDDDSLLMPVIDQLSVPVSEMFRDPPVFRLLAEQVLPRLASYPEINIWQAGCAHGQEVYSLAVLLTEAGLYPRCRIYATDISEGALREAAAGVYPLRDARTFSENYLAAGGRQSLSDHYLARYEHISFDPALRRNVVFLRHNLAADGVFCEAHLILCRNVLIYFGQSLQDRALGLFRDSLVRGGYLCLGAREEIGQSGCARAFEAVDPGARLFRLAAQSQ